MSFKVTKHYGRGESLIGQFKTQREAETEIQKKLIEDQNLKVTATYKLSEWGDVLKEYTQADIVETSSDSGSDSQSAGKPGSGKTYNPTPFSTSLTLGPKSFVKDREGGEDKDKDKDK